MDDNDTLMACKLKNFVECSEKNRYFYRTKSEFSIGFSSFDGRIVVGFHAGGASNNSVERGQVYTDIPTLTRQAFEISVICEKLIKDSELLVYNRIERDGFWRNIAVRQSDRTKEVLVNIIGCQRDCPQELFDSEIKDKFTKGFEVLFEQNEGLAGLGYKLSGLVFQNCEEISDVVPIDPDHFEILSGGKSYYNETILGVNFEVSPTSFLQVNIEMCEKLYKTIDDFCMQALVAEKNFLTKAKTEEISEVKLPQEYILLDIFSGIGTIGLCLGKNAKKVIGIEINEKACMDAIQNAKRNGIENYEVVVGKAEEKLREVVKKYQGTGIPLIGVVDPPRAGIHPTVISSLRTCVGLDHLIFIACDITQSKGNILKLCTPPTKKNKGPPFSPMSCVGLDLFPHTPHLEAVVHLQRLYE